MSLASEYQNQFAWRDWNTALDLCPIVPGQRVLDLGCGPGDVSQALSMRGIQVTGIDANVALIEEARTKYPGLDFKIGDLQTLDLEVGRYDGIWCSFAAAYFTDFECVFRGWLPFLKPKAWICLIDVDDLFAHEPMRPAWRQRVLDFYGASVEKRHYDFRVGGKLEDILRRNGFTVESRVLRDDELSFTGAASPAIRKAWSDRIDRMRGLHSHFAGEVADFKVALLETLAQENHVSHCSVICAVGARTG